MLNASISALNVSDLSKAQMAVNGYGVNLNLTNTERCRVLYETLIQNYPCMKEQYCTPFGTTPGAFIFWSVVFGIILIYGGWKLREYLKEKKKEE